MKIGVASSDGEYTVHFGKAQGFVIFLWDGEEKEYVELRRTNINPEAKHQWIEILSKINDCQVIIAAQAGMKAKYGLKKEGIKFVEDEGTVEEVVDRFIQHEKFMDQL